MNSPRDRSPETPSSKLSSGRTTGVTRRLETSDVVQVAQSALRILRGVSDATVRDELLQIDESLGRAVLADEVRELIARLDKIRPDGTLTAAATVVTGDSREALRRLVDASIPIANGLEEAAAANALTRSLGQLVAGAAADSITGTAVQTLGELAEAAARSTQKRGTLERMTEELLSSLERLATSDGQAASSAQALSSQIRQTSTIHELQALRTKLLDHAEELVRVASSRDQEARSVTAELREQAEKVKILESRLSAVTEQSLTDPLTKLSNRRGLDAMLERLKGTSHVGVLAIDIDHFKKFNDTYGHAAGDAVLRHIADLIRADLRIGDHAFRTGGEEMLILLPDADWTGARATATRVHKRIEQSQVDLGTSTVRVTVSIGISVWSDGETFEAAAERADAALYRAKALGRSRVVG